MYITIKKEAENLRENRGEAREELMGIKGGEIL